MIFVTKNKYFEIYQSIKTAITNGVYAPESKLPSEHTLCQLYDVSRNTIRRALEVLAQEGFVTSVHGKGVFVMAKPPLHLLVGGLQSFSEVSAQTGIHVETTIPVFETMVVDSQLAQKTGFHIGSHVFHVVRIRTIDHVKAILDENFFDCTLVPTLTRSICEQSIYDFIEHTLQLKINGAQKAICMEQASPLDQTYLEIPSHQFVAVIKNTVYLETGHQFEYTESHHLPEKFTFHTFARRA